MKSSQVFASLSVIMVLAVIVVGMATPVVQASDAQYSAAAFFDPFDGLSTAYWCVVSDESSSVTAESQDGVSFARLALFPDPTPGDFSIAELTPCDKTGAWLPTVLHPVVLQTRLRWSPSYTPGLSGSALGTSGIWLWNSPIVTQPDGSSSYGPTEAFGISWATDGTFRAAGFNATIVRGFPPIPQYVQPLPAVDMSNWLEFAVVWSQVNPHVQQVDFYLNRVLVGSRRMPPMGPLTVEIWNDNQRTSIRGSQFGNPVEMQAMDIDFIAVSGQ